MQLLGMIKYFINKIKNKEYEEWNGAYNKTSALEFMRDHGWTWLIVTGLYPVPFSTLKCIFNSLSELIVAM